MVEAFKVQSQCNSGFLMAALRAEGLFASDPEHKGLSILAGDIDVWEKSMREKEPPLVDGKPETAPLHPAPPETKFKAKAKASAEGDDTPSDADDSANDSAGAPKRRMLVRVKKKFPSQADGSKGDVPSSADSVPADGSPTDQGEAAVNAVA